jgi:hypothetical protein
VQADSTRALSSPGLGLATGGNPKDSGADDAGGSGGNSPTFWRTKMTMRLEPPQATLAALLAAIVGLLVVSNACRHERRAPARRTPQTLATTVAPDPSSFPASTDSPEDKALGVGGEVWQFVSAWSDALDRHDTNALGGLYAEEVGFYGQRRTKAAVVHAKQAVLNSCPTFRQQIPGFIDVRSVEDFYVARFSAHFGASNDLRDRDLRLVLRRGDGGPLLIVEEVDDATAEKQQERCETVAAEVVNALPQVKRRIAQAWARADASGGRLRFGGIGPQHVDVPNGFFASIGIHSDERCETVASYEVDRDGRLRLSIAGEPLPVVSPGALGRVARACKR